MPAVPKPKIIKTSSMENGLNRLCREIVFERDGHECVICRLLGVESKSDLQPAHIISRQHILLIWEIDNIITLCKNHHIYGAHSNRRLSEDILTAFFIAMYPERWEKIQRLRAQTFTGNYMEFMIDKKRELINFKGDV